MLDKQMIPHLKGLDIGVKICQEQLCSSISDDHATFLVKDTLFKEEVAWQPLKELESCSSSILEPLSRAFMWVIICLSTTIGCGEIKSNVKKCQSYVVKMDIFWHESKSENVKGLVYFMIFSKDIETIGCLQTFLQTLFYFFTL